MYDVYKHYRGAHYVRLTSALHSEDLEPYTVYRTLYDNPKSRVWVRPTEMFHGKADNTEQRFSVVGKVSRAFPEDEEELATFGYDTWGQGKPIATFVSEDLQSRDTLRGERWFFQAPGGEKVSVLNVLRFSRGVIGLASVATHPNHRGKGFASLLLRTVMELLWLEDPATRFLLFAEAGQAMYAKLGFSPLADIDQHFKPAIAMATGDNPPTPFERELVRVYF